MISEGLQAYSGKRVLMLQGPHGPFFARVAADLAQVGAKMHKVNFNGGDWLFALSGRWDHVSNFTGRIDEWPAFFSALLVRFRIDVVFLFGDCRPIHVPALTIARQLGIEVGVFEEGYLRPDHITLERGGVNNRSSLPQDPSFYLEQDRSSSSVTSPVGSTFRHAAFWSILYYLAAIIARPAFRYYWHHRRIGLVDGLYWIRSFARKIKYRRQEQCLDRRLLGPEPDRFFLVALQTSGDAQIKVHSRFRSIPRFIEFTIRSFARKAPADTILVVKHHPLDRGYTDYSALIGTLSRQYQIQARCLYIHDQHLPTLLRNARGVVVVNSTVGLSAVGEGVPVKVCGEGIYDIPGLTFQGDLDSFWSLADCFQPNMKLWHAFRGYLLARTQFNGSFYRKLPSTGYRSGVVWTVPPVQAEEQTIPLAVAAKTVPPMPLAAASSAGREDVAETAAEAPAVAASDLPVEEFAPAG